MPLLLHVTDLESPLLSILKSALVKERRKRKTTTALSIVDLWKFLKKKKNLEFVLLLNVNITNALLCL